MTIRFGFKYWLGIAVSFVFSITCAAQSAVIHPDLPGYSQSQFEGFERCAGEFLAKQALLRRIKDDLDAPYAQYAKKLTTKANLLRVALRFYAQTSSR